MNIFKGSLCNLTISTKSTQFVLSINATRNYRCSSQKGGKLFRDNTTTSDYLRLS